MITLNKRRVGPDYPPFLIAEAGINHNGDLDRALAMVRVAKQAGAEAVKFQTYVAEEFVGDLKQTFTYRSQGRKVTDLMFDMLKQCELPPTAWHRIKAECDHEGILFLSTPQSFSDLELLIDVGMTAIKVGSDEFTNLHLINKYAATGLPMILSCGMADMAEVFRSVEHIGGFDGNPIALLSCTSQYPTPPADVNLLKLSTLRAAFPNLVVGFSDHTQGPQAATMAAALGASIFEKHFTLDQDLPGPDHWFAETPDGIAGWVQSVRRAFDILGSGIIRPTYAESQLRQITRRSIVASKRIARGELLTADNIGVRRPGTGLPPEMLAHVLGSKAKRIIRAGEPIQMGDI